jgi:hypothetical protein
MGSAESIESRPGQFTSGQPAPFEFHIFREAEPPKTPVDIYTRHTLLSSRLEAAAKQKDKTGVLGETRSVSLNISATCVCGDRLTVFRSCPACARALCGDCSRIHPLCHACGDDVCRECALYYQTSVSKLPIPVCAKCEPDLVRDSLAVKFEPAREPKLDPGETLEDSPDKK